MRQPDLGPLCPTLPRTPCPLPAQKFHQLTSRREGAVCAPVASFPIPRGTLSHSTSHKEVPGIPRPPQRPAEP